MTTTTRNFVLGSAAILMVGLGVGFVAYHGGLAGLAARHAGPAELSYLPADAAVVAYANVGEVMRSDFRERMRAILPKDDQGKGRQEFEQATGIDLERDVQGVTACLQPAQGEPMPLVAIRGTFDTGRIEAFARTHGATVEIYQGVRVIVAPEDQDRDRRGEEPGDGQPRRDAGKSSRPAMAFVEPGLMLVGTPASVRAAIDHNRSGQNLTANTDLMSRIARMDAQAASAWAFGRVDVLTSQGKLPQELTSRMPAVTWFEAAGHVNGGVRGTLRAEARDDESARNLRDMMNGVMAFGRLQAQSNPQVQLLLQSITLGGSGRSIELSFVVPSEVIEGLAARGRDGAGL